MTDFTVNGKDFVYFKKMDLFTQAHVVRRFGRLSFIMSIIQEHMNEGEPLTKVIDRNIPAIMLAVGSLNDPDFEYVQNACLDILKVNLNGAWTPIRAGSALAWGDMELIDLCKLLGYVIKDVFFPFFQEVSRLSPPDQTTDSAV